MHASNEHSFLDIPTREGKPRERGLTHVMDKGLNLREIEGLFDSGATVTLDALRTVGLIHNLRLPVKVLARGEVTKAFTVHAHKFSGSAAEKIAAAGGSAEVIALVAKA